MNKLIQMHHKYYQPPVAADDLIAYWKFEADYSCSVSDYHGTEVGTPANHWFDTDAKEGTYSWENQYSGGNAVSVGQIPFPTTFTICFWHKVLNDTNTSADVLFANGRNTSPGGFAIWLNSWATTDGAIRVYTWDSSVNQDGITTITGVYNSNAWNHIGISYNAGTWQFVINGTDRGSDTTQTDFARSGVNTTLGNYPNFAYGANGNMDDFRIYNVEKTVAEIQAIRNEYL